METHGVEPTSPSKRETLLDWFVGSVLLQKIEVTDEFMEMLTDKAGEYMMTRGRMPEWEEWCLLGEASKEAFRTALGNVVIRQALEKK